MLLTSCLIDGIELISYLLVKPTTLTRESGDRIGSATLEFLGVPDSIGSLIRSQATVEIFSGDPSEVALFGEVLPGEVLFGTFGAGSERQFIGKVSRIEPRAVRLAADGQGYTVFRVQCQDYMVELDRISIDAEVLNALTSPATSDAAVINYIFGEYAPLIDLTGVQNVSSSLELFVRDGWTLRQFMNEVAKRTGATWYLNGTKLNYHWAGGVAAPFGIREYSNESEPIPAYEALYKGFQFIEESTTVWNRVTVKGKAGSDGVRVTATVDDLDSQALYGVCSRGTIYDDNIQTETEAVTRAQVQLLESAEPQRSCRFNIRSDGLSVGQALTFVMPSIVQDVTLVINRMSLKWETPQVVTYTVDCGSYLPSLVHKVYQNTIQSTVSAFLPTEDAGTSDGVIAYA